MKPITLNITWCYKDNPKVRFRFISKELSEQSSLIILRTFYDKIKSFAVVEGVKEYDR